MMVLSCCICCDVDVFVSVSFYWCLGLFLCGARFGLGGRVFTVALRRCRLYCVVCVFLVICSLVGVRFGVVVVIVYCLCLLV